MVADEVRGQGQLAQIRQLLFDGLDDLDQAVDASRRESLGVDERLRRSLGQVTLLWQLFHWCAGCENLGDGQVIGVAEQLEYV